MHLFENSPIVWYIMQLNMSYDIMHTQGPARSSAVILSAQYLLCILQKRLEQDPQILQHSKMPAKVGHNGAWMQREYFHACLLSPAHTIHTYTQTVRDASANEQCSNAFEESLLVQTGLLA